MKLSLSHERALSSLLLGGLLLGCGGGGSDTPQVTTPTNQSPTVTISGETSVTENDYLTLTANVADSDGSIASVSWSVSSGDGITLEGSDSENVSFQVPFVNSDTVIVLDVAVTDDDGAKTTQQVSVTILSTQTTLTFSGVVTDNIIKNADVEIIIGNNIFTATADENGVYTITITVDDSVIDELVQIRARGDSSINPEVEFVSQLSSISSLLAQVGDNGTVDKEQDFGVNVTNVTTAEYALLSRDGTIPTTSEELASSISRIDNEEKNILAALIKIIVDNDDYELPLGSSSTLDLVNDSVATNFFHQSVLTQDPTLIPETISSIVNDNSLSEETNIVGTWSIGSDVITFMRSGHYVHITTEAEEGDCNQIGYELGTYSWSQETSTLSFTTKEDTNGCSGLFDEENGQLINTLIEHDSIFTATNDSLTIDENGEIFTAERLTSGTNPFVGGHYLQNTDFSDDLSMLITLDDNRAVFLYRLESSGLPTNISYLYILRNYTYDEETALRIVHSQQVYVDGNITSEKTEEVWRASITTHGDVISMTNGDGTSFIRNSFSNTAQDYLADEDIIGNVSGTIGDSFTFNATFNNDSTGQASDFLLEQWEIIFGQLLLTETDGTTQIWSPASITNDISQFTVTQYNDAGNFESSNTGTLSYSDLVVSNPIQSTDAAIVGTWAIDNLSVLTFTASGHYVHIRNGEDSDCGQAGYEVGSYTWDENSGIMNINTRVDTNGCVGLHEEQSLNTPFSLGSTITVAGNNLQGTEIASGEEFNFIRVIDSANALIGAYYEGDFDDEFGVSIFVNDTDFIEVSHFDNKQGLNSGNYSWNSETTLLDFGDININQLDDSYDQAVVKIQGDILLWKDDDDAGVMKRTQTTNDQPYFTENDIIGSFSGVVQDSSFKLTFNSDYTALEVNDDGIFNYVWRIEFGQLLLDDGWLTVISPLEILPEGISVDLAEFNLEANTDSGETGSFEYRSSSFWIKN